jgi:O-acetyl-ADP-ribose deacetylase (regulator of RNase III)
MADGPDAAADSGRSEGVWREGDREAKIPAVRLILGDITEQQVDAIVNAANSSLLGGGGVDGAIHRRGGPEILRACQALRTGPLQAGLPPGQAVATTAGRLPAQHVIHVVGPVWSRREDRSNQLRSCYAQALRVADELHARTVAFPAVSAGIYGWPVDDAARIAVGTVLSTPSELQEARFVLFSRDVYSAFEAALSGFGNGTERPDD